MKKLHLSVPLRKGANGFFAMVSEEDAISENLKSIFFTSPGERVFRPEIGVPLNQLVFDPADSVFESLLRLYIRLSVSQFETRVVLEDVQIAREETEDNGMRIRVSLTCRYKSGQVRSVPVQAIFYKIT